jgi:predicted membrane channel-forming protein YqfA (hemolysin III family)
VPAAAVAGVPGVVVGVLLDESVVTRSVFAVGGTMYVIGATTYALTHPQTEQV